MSCATGSVSEAVEQIYALAATGNKQKVIDAWNRFQEEFPEAPESIAWGIKRALDDQGLEAAKALIDTLTEAQKQEPVVQACMAGVLGREGRLDDAVALIEEALAAAPEHPGVIGNAARVLSKAGQQGRATALLTEWTVRRPHDPIGYQLVATQIFNRRALSELHSYLNNAPLSYMSTYLHALMSYKLALLEEDTAKSIACARQARAKAPESSQAASVLAFALYRVGAFDEAKAEANAALELDPKNRSAKTTLARIASKRGDAEEMEANPMPYAKDDRPESAELNAFEGAVDRIYTQDVEENLSDFRELEEHAKNVRLRTGAMKTTLGRLIHKRDQEGVQRVLDGLLADEPECPDRYVAAWAMQFYWGDWKESYRIAREGVQRFPACVKLRARMMQTLSRSTVKGPFLRMAYEFIRYLPATSGECASVSVALLGSNRRDLAKRFRAQVARKYPNDVWVKRQSEKFAEFSREHESDHRVRRWFVARLQLVQDQLDMMKPQ